MKNAMRVWNDKSLNLRDLLLQEKEVMSRFKKKELGSLFNLDYHLKHVGTIFKRVLGRR